MLLNRGIEFPVDFQSWDVYALTIANAAILFGVSWRGSSAPRLSFALLCGALPFSVYLFVVFLPYTPLAVLFFGAGFLILAPTLLLALHLYLLHRAREALRAGRAPRSAMVAGACGVLLLPASIVGRARKRGKIGAGGMLTRSGCGR